MIKKYWLHLSMALLVLALVAAQCGPAPTPDTAALDAANAAAADAEARAAEAEAAAANAQATADAAVEAGAEELAAAKAEAEAAKEEAEMAMAEAEAAKAEAEAAMAEAPAELEDVTLVVWFLSGSPEEIELVQGVTDAWAANYDKANVTIDFSPFGFEDMNNALKLALDGGTGPDVAYTSPGGQFLEAYAAAGHIVDLTDILAERGWDEMVPGEVIHHFATTDRVYGIPYEVVTVGVYYNAEIYDELGLEPPATFAEFEEQLAAIKEAGMTPISVGGSNGWPLMHIWDQLLHTTVPWENLGVLQDLDPDAAWNTPEMLQAAEKYEEWVNLGYLNENAVATDYQDGNNLFITGQSALYIGGTWNNATFNEQAEFEVRFFSMPPVNPDLEFHMGGYTPNNAWTVPVYSEHQNIALDFVGHMLGEEVATVRWNSGAIPSFLFDEVPEPVYPLQADVYDSTLEAATGQYSDNPSEISSLAYANLQELTAGRMIAQELVDSLQEQYLELIAEQE